MGCRGARWGAPVLAALIAAACGGDDGVRTSAPQDTDAADDGGDGDGDDDGDDGDGDDGADDDGADDGVDPGEWEPAPAVLPRLTGTQYRNSLQALLGEGLPPTPIEPDTNPYLFYSIGATSTTLSELGAQMYEEAADTVAEHVFSDPARRLALVGCEPMKPGDACVAGFVASFGRRAFRRPLTATEQARWLGVATSLADGGDAWLGLRMAVAGILQSPWFLYRVELGEPDPDEASRLRYTSLEMASRLSFLLWNTTPDDALLQAGEDGALLTEDGIVEQAERLLADPRARTAVQDFFAQYFDLSRLSGLTRNPDDYPLFTETLPIAMRNEVRLLVDDFVFGRDDDIRGVFSTRRTFVNDELAALYGVQAEGASAISYVPVELPEDGARAGLLTLGAFLAMNAHETENSPTLRGKYVRERVLCQTVPPPPDDVDTNLPDDTGEGKTLRERLEEHRTNPECSGCHSFIDPPGFLFEHFDPIGAYRTTDNGYPVDATGDLDGVPLDDARDLADLLGDDPRVGRCVVNQLYRHANGRLEATGELLALADIDEQFADAGYRFQDLVITLVTHDAFRVLGSEEGGQ